MAISITEQDILNYRNKNHDKSYYKMAKYFNVDIKVILDLLNYDCWELQDEGHADSETILIFNNVDGERLIHSEDKLTNNWLTYKYVTNDEGTTVSVYEIDGWLYDSYEHY